jgi:hypothetical protein
MGIMTRWEYILYHLSSHVNYTDTQCSLDNLIMPYMGLQLLIMEDEIGCHGAQYEIESPGKQGISAVLCEFQRSFMYHKLRLLYPVDI